MPSLGVGERPWWRRIHRPWQGALVGVGGGLGFYLAEAKPMTDWSPALRTAAIWASGLMAFLVAAMVLTSLLLLLDRSGGAE